jgi:PAS domain S-box-containing protein
VGVAGVVAGLLATTGLATSWLWRQRQKNLLHERFSAELDQKRATARLGLVMRHAKDIIFVVDENQRFVDANQQALDAYGWTKEEMLRLTIWDIRAPETLKELPADIARIRAEEGTIFQSTHRRKDGTTFPVESSVRQVEIDGQPHFLSIIRDISERRQAEAKLRGSEEKFSKAFRANPSGIAITELASGRFIEVNESFCRIMRCSPQDVIGRTSVELGTWGSSDDRSQMVKPLSTDGSLRNFELQTRTLDGEAKTVLLHAELIELNGQRCVLSLIEDITDRKRTEAALRASEERYRLIADNTSDVIWLYDMAEDGYSYVSPSVFAMRGFRPEEVIGQKLAAPLSPASAEKVTRLLRDLIAQAEGDRSRRDVVVEVDQLRKDGSVVPTEVVASLLLDASGRPTHVLGIARDITERQRVRETLEKFNTELEEQVELRTAELAARNREIEALVGSIPDTVLLCDEHGELVTSHFAQNHTSSFPFATAGAGDGLSSQHPVLLEIARELHAVAWASQQTIMLEFDRKINGVDYSIEARATPAGENRLLILLRDISARKRSERVAQANLERERQLSEMKTQFISVASHEFRTPLAAATGSLELLERHATKITEAKRVELLTRAQRSLGRLTTIMDNVLQLSRADSGRVTVKRMTIDLVQFVQDLIREVEAGDRHSHTFTFQPSGKGDAVPVDTNLFNHILSNLLGNAVRYSPAGTKISVTLDIGAQAFSLTVADEGIGIPEAERERVFEPFARGSNVGQINGTGLGLNIVKRYTELMGGRIELLRTERGAAFRVNLPWLQPDK